MNSIAERLASSLKIRPGEGRKAALLIGLLLSVTVGGSIGGTGMDALFYSRFRIEPYYYILLGLVTFVNLMAVTSLLNRVSRERLYVVLPFALALVLLGEWALVILKAYWFYPVMWLSKEVLNSLAGLFSWGLAAAVCDTRHHTGDQSNGHYPAPARAHHYAGAVTWSRLPNSNRRARYWTTR